MNQSTNPTAGGPGRNPLLPIYVLGVMTVIAVAVMTVLLCLPPRPTAGEFVPPAFDTAAEPGVPSVPEELGYWAPYQNGLTYRFALCGILRTDGDAVTVYFTSHAENTVYLKLRILDAEGQILGETGLLKPGEYVRTVELTRQPAQRDAEVTVKIMGYEPESYLSAGAVTIRGKLNG